MQYYNTLIYNILLYDDVMSNLGRLSPFYRYCFN